MATIRRLAVEYRRHGFNLLPVGPDKRPILASWRGWGVERQTAADLKAMDWKKATGVAAIGGSVSGGLCCLDFDHVTRDDLLAEVLDRLGLPADYPWSVSTPGGGLHVWILCNDLDRLLGDKGKAKAEMEGCHHVELRGRGHYTILPGSQHPNGGTYAFAYGEPEMVPTDPPTVVEPDVLAGLVAWDGDGDERQTQTATTSTVATDHPYVKAAIEDEVAQLTTATEGERNDQLNNSAFALGSLPLSLDDVQSALLPVALRIGLTEKESLRTIASGYEAGQKTPREPPHDGSGPAINWGAAEAEVKPTHRAIVRTLSTVEPEDITWLWPGRIARGKLTLIAGDPGLGKSFMTLDIAARLSTGASWPDGGSAPTADVLLLTAEDGVADTIVPRLQRMGADMDRVHVLESVLDPKDDHERLFRLRTDLAALEDAVEQVHPAVVVVDPLSAYLAGIDSHRSAEVRSALAPLMTLGERTGVTPLCTAHLSKAESRSAIYRISGSLDFVAAARAAFLVAEDPEEDSRRLVLPMKMNIAEKPPGIGFSILDGAVVWDNRPVTVSLFDVLTPNRESRTKLEAAKLLLREVLAGGPVSEPEVEAQAKREGIGPRTLRRAKESLGVASEKKGIIGGWEWSLPIPERSKTEGGQTPLGNLLDTFEEVQDGQLGRCPNLGAVGLGHLRDGQVGSPTCGHDTHRRFWRRPKGQWRCAVCHPPASSDDLEWIDLDDSPGEGSQPKLRLMTDPRK